MPIEAIMKMRYWVGGVSIFALVILLKLITTPIDANPDKFKVGKTLAVLVLCGGAIEIWIEKHRRMPCEEEGLSVLEMKQSIEIDGWDRPIIYKSQPRDAKGGFLLYSMGRNGIDENGRGDDIVYSTQGSEKFQHKLAR